jgi:hypothetical protein
MNVNMRATQSNVCSIKHSVFVLTSYLDEESVRSFFAITFEGTETPGNHLINIPPHILLKEFLAQVSTINTFCVTQHVVFTTYDKNLFIFLGQLLKLERSEFIINK